MERPVHPELLPRLPVPGQVEYDACILLLSSLQQVSHALDIAT